jgi:hyperosmotically inducible periplasmic protein
MIPVLRFAVLACALGLAACAEEAARPAAAQPAPAADPNKVLVERVRQALVSDREIAANDIDVSAKGGVVSLWGKVGSAREIQRAQEVARGIPGVQRVENNLKVN